jgi:cobyrinic acid a,c-diamide synthase
MESQVADASTTANPDVRIAVARDAAFGFYYPDDLEALEDAGAKLLFFDALSDSELPAADGLFIGGGFPEMCLPALAANKSLRADIRQKLAAGMPAYAECGGLMYLAKNIQWRDEKYDMVGVVPGDIVVHDGPQGRGYVVLEETGQSLWSPASVGPPQSDATIPAHEFHYARLENLAGESGYAYRCRWSARWPDRWQSSGRICAPSKHRGRSLGQTFRGFCPGDVKSRVLGGTPATR